MNYVTEARRLHIPLPEGFRENFDGTALDRPAWSNLREDGLCISNCPTCRTLRMDVRAARAEEEEQARAAEQRISQSEQNLNDWVEEESHAIEAFEEALRHIELLPPSDLRQTTLYGLQATISAARLAFRENAFAQSAAHGDLVSGNIEAGASVPGQSRDPIADLLALFAAPGAEVQFVSTFED